MLQKLDMVIPTEVLGLSNIEIIDIHLRDKIGSVGRLAPTAHRTVRTDPYTAPHVKHTSMLS